MANKGEKIVDELTPRQMEFIRLYNDPKSKTFSNAYRSAIEAGYTEEYATSITGKGNEWMAENVSRRKRMLEKAENRLEKLLGSKDERVAGDIAKFVAKTVGKDNYSDRTEHTGKDGKDLMPTPILGGISQDVSANNSTSQNTTIKKAS